MSKNSKMSLLQISSVYETKPLGNTNQSNFLNAVIKMKTSYSLVEMIDYLKNLEIELGRKESEKWGPREIDLDLLFFDDIVFENDRVKVPHYGIQDRDFVLIPLNEIAACQESFPENLREDNFLKFFRFAVSNPIKTKILPIKTRFDNCS